MPATTKTWLKTLVPSVSDAELEAVTRQHAGDRIGALDALLTALWRQDGAQPATSPAIGGGGAKGRRRKRARPRETDAPADAADAGARAGSTTTRALRPEPSQRSDGSDAESDCIAGPSEAQQRGARAELRATPSAPSIAAAVAPALGFLRRAADSFKWETCPYLQLVQARCGEIWRDVGRYGEMWGDMGRPARTSSSNSSVTSELARAGAAPATLGRAGRARVRRARRGGAALARPAAAHAAPAAREGGPAVRAVRLLLANRARWPSGARLARVARLDADGRRPINDACGMRND